MKTTVKQSIVHSIKGLVFPTISNNYLYLALAAIVSYIIMPSFLFPVWLLLISLLSINTINMERNNETFDNASLDLIYNNEFKKLFKTSIIWSLILSIFTGLNLEYTGFISSIFVLSLFGLYILHTFKFIKKEEDSSKVKELEDNWLLFIGINIIFLFLSTWLYTPILAICYIFTMYSMSFEKIKKN